MEHNPSLTRCTSTLLHSASSFVIDSKNKSYNHQYSNIYFTRLIALKKPVMERARAKWKDLPGRPLHVPRVLDVVKSKLCWVIGTLYMDMPLKPNVLEDLGRDYSIPPPPPREKFYSDEDSIMLEDESGRVKLVGERLRSNQLVTGVIVAALGMETVHGDFEVVDFCYPGLAPFAEADSLSNDSMDVDNCSSPRDQYLAAVSGFSIGAASAADAQIQMLTEYLTGELGGSDDQKLAAKVTRLVIAGDSLSASGENGDDDEEMRLRKAANVPRPSKLSTHPNLTLSEHLSDLLSALPIHILPGADDPAGAILPQQPFPRAMFGAAAKFESFCCETNPTWLRIECSSGSDDTTPIKAGPSTSRCDHPTVTRSVLVTSGQPILDMCQYLPSPPSTHLSIACSTLTWRHIAPTAPDTLWCHPFREKDPFVLRETPDIYIVGGMPRFATDLVSADHGDDKAHRKCRVVLVPKFSESGVLVLVNLRTLGVQCIDFGVTGMIAGGAEPARDAMREG